MIKRSEFLKTNAWFVGQNSFFDDASHATALRFASIPENPPQGPCSRQLLLHGCTHNCAHMFSHMHPVDIPKMKLPIHTVNVPNDIGVWII